MIRVRARVKARVRVRVRVRVRIWVRVRVRFYNAPLTPEKALEELQFRQMGN